MYLTRFLDSVITYHSENLERTIEQVQNFISVFGSEYKVTNAEVLHNGFDGNLIDKKCVLVSFYPKIKFVNQFIFSEFSNAFYTHKDTSIDLAREYCLNFLNTNYAHLAPFTIERIETKEGSKGTTSNNKYLQSNEMLITFYPVINTNWD